MWYTEECDQWIDSLHDLEKVLNWRTQILPAQNRMRPSAAMLVERLNERGWICERIKGTPSWRSPNWYNPDTYWKNEDGEIVQHLLGEDWEAGVKELEGVSRRKLRV